MPAIFDALPGLDVPAGAISKSLAKMWSDTASKGGPAPAADDGKATQVNLVLHLGYGTLAADAVAQFETTVRFSRRYPSRVVVLCPLPPDDQSTDIRAKVYGECHLGKSKGDTRCCEFVILSYPQAARQHLENQVSICLSTDLPLYYWAHRFSSSGRLADYQYLLRRSVRVLFDTSLVPADAVDFAWPRKDAVRDLVHARLLPVRQTIGQFLSGYSPATLTQDLKLVTVGHDSSHLAEAEVLKGWAQRRLIACGAPAELASHVCPLPGGSTASLSLEFEYTDGKRFLWTGNLAAGSAEFSANFGNGPVSLNAAVSLLSPEAALAEAMFF